MTPRSSLVLEAAEFVTALTRETIPPSIWEKARRALLHNMAVAMAGSTLAQTALEWGRRRSPAATGARVLHLGSRVGAADAAFVNACIMHARAQDDIHLPSLSHFGAAAVPAALAIGESDDLSGEDLIVALVAGYEVAAWIGEGVAAQSTTNGFRASGIYGVFAAAAAASRLMALECDEVAHALAIASSFASGTNQTWLGGTEEYQFQVGAASRNGVEASLIAAAGGSGSPDALEGAAGFYRAFLGTVPDAPDATTLGQQWRIRDVTFKPYPVCALLQAPIEEAIVLRRCQGRDVVVDRATLTLSPVEAAYPGTREKGPFIAHSAALMSAAFCLSVALGEGKFEASDLLRFDEPQLLERAQHVTVVADADLAPREFRLRASFTDGRAAGTDFSPTPATFNWPQDELERRVLSLADEFPDWCDANSLISAIARIEDMRIADLVDVCLQPSLERL